MTAKILHAEYHIEYRFLGEVCLGSAHGFRLLPNIAVFDLTGSFLEGLPLKSCSSNHNPKYGAHASFSSNRALLPTHQKKKERKKGFNKGAGCTKRSIRVDSSGRIRLSIYGVPPNCSTPDPASGPSSSPLLFPQFFLLLFSSSSFVTYKTRQGTDVGSTVITMQMQRMSTSSPRTSNSSDLPLTEPHGEPDAQPGLRQQGPESRTLALHPSFYIL